MHSITQTGVMIEYIIARIKGFANWKGESVHRFHMVADICFPDDDNTIPKDDNTIPEADNCIPDNDNTIPEDDNTLPDDDNTLPKDDITFPVVVF